MTSKWGLIEWGQFWNSSKRVEICNLILQQVLVKFAGENHWESWNLKSNTLKGTHEIFCSADHTDLHTSIWGLHTLHLLSSIISQVPCLTWSLELLLHLWLRFKTFKWGLKSLYERKSPSTISETYWLFIYLQQFQQMGQSLLTMTIIAQLYEEEDALFLLQ